MEVDDGLLLWYWWPQRPNHRTATRIQVAVLATMVEDVMRAHHDHLLGGHLGEKRTLERVRVHYWWPRMYSQVRRWVAECPTCQQRNDPKGRRPGLLQPIPPSTRPFERVGVDLIGPLPKTTAGNQHLLVFVDYLTKWPEVFAIPDAKAETVAKVFVEQVVCRHGAPEVLLSDRGAVFLSKVLQEVNAYLRVQKANTSAYHPQTDGLVERFNGTLEGLLAKVVSEQQDDWDLFLPYVLYAYRASQHESTGDSPFYLIFGQEPNGPIDVTAGVPVDALGTSTRQYRSELVTRLQDAWQLAIDAQKRAQAANRRHYDRGRDEPSYAAGDKVLLRVGQLPQGRTFKLAKPWSGPYRITELRSKLVAVVQHVNNPRDVQKVNVRRLKPYNDGDSLSDSLERLRQQQDGIEELEIEAILDDRLQNGRQQFLLRFKGFTKRYDTWVDREDIDADELLPRYEQSRKTRAAAKPATASVSKGGM